MIHWLLRHSIPEHEHAHCKSKTSLTSRQNLRARVQLGRAGGSDSMSSVPGDHGVSGARGVFNERGCQFSTNELILKPRL
jgi:hypothetical protein